VVQAGAPLIEIGDPSNLELTVDLLSRDAVRVEAGAAARVENWGGEPLNARVRRIEPAGFTKVSALGIEEQRVKVVLDFTDPPDRWQRLGHGFRVIVRITVWKEDRVPLVPLGSLFRSGDAWAVFKVVDGRARRQLVEIAERNLRHARIVGGLTEGETVILHPSDRVADGVRVEER
jgi:HlyD family secretion protein